MKRSEKRVSKRRVEKRKDPHPFSQRQHIRSPPFIAVRSADEHSILRSVNIPKVPFTDTTTTAATTTTTNYTL